MAELPELKKEYLFQIKKQLRVAKKKFFRAYRFHCEGKIPYHSFLEKYGIPLTNIAMKIEAFKEFFAELDVKYPQIPDFEELFERRVEFWYHNSPKVEKLIYKGQEITIKYDYYTDLLHEYWAEYI